MQPFHSLFFKDSQMNQDNNLFIGMCLVRLTAFRQLVEDILYSYPAPPQEEIERLQRKIEQVQEAERIAAKNGNIHPLT